MTALPADVTTNPADLRKAILSKMGIDPSKLVAFGANDAAFDDQVTNLYRTALAKYGGLDTQSARLQQDYENSLARGEMANRHNIRAMEGDLADRGLLFSGAAINRRAKLGTDYANQIQNLNQART